MAARPRHDELMAEMMRAVQSKAPKGATLPTRLPSQGSGVAPKGGSLCSPLPRQVSGLTSNEESLLSLPSMWVSGHTSTGRSPLSPPATQTSGHTSTGGVLLSPSPMPLSGVTTKGGPLLPLSPMQLSGLTLGTSGGQCASDSKAPRNSSSAGQDFDLTDGRATLQTPASKFTVPCRESNGTGYTSSNLLVAPSSSLVTNVDYQGQPATVWLRAPPPKLSHRLGPKPYAAPASTINSVTAQLSIPTSVSATNDISKPPAWMPVRLVRHLEEEVLDKPNQEQQWKSQAASPDGSVVPSGASSSQPFNSNGWQVQFKSPSPSPLGEGRRGHNLPSHSPLGTSDLANRQDTVHSLQQTRQCETNTEKLAPSLNGAQNARWPCSSPSTLSPPSLSGTARPRQAAGETTTDRDLEDNVVESCSVIQLRARFQSPSQRMPHANCSMQTTIASNPAQNGTSAHDMPRETPAPNQLKHKHKMEDNNCMQQKQQQQTQTSMSQETQQNSPWDYANRQRRKSVAGPNPNGAAVTSAVATGSVMPAAPLNGATRLSSVQQPQSPMSAAVLGVCSKCAMPIRGDVGGCVAMGKKFHLHCLTCARCGKELAGQIFYGVENLPHCDACYKSTLEKCSVCQEGIPGRLLRAAGKPYHPLCFNCIVCRHSLDGAQFVMNVDNEAHCVEDYYLKYAPRCDACHKPITPEEGQEAAVQVTMLGHSYHVDCCRCEDCGKVILSESVEVAACYPLDGHLLCKLCNNFRRSTQYLPTKCNQVE